MEFKRRRMIKSEIDRLLSDEGTRNLLSGIKKSKKLTRIVTRNNRVPANKSASTKGIIITNTRLKVNNNKEKSKKIIKKSLNLLGQGKKNKSTIINEDAVAASISSIAKKSIESSKINKSPKNASAGKSKMSNGLSNGAAKISASKISNGPSGAKVCNPKLSHGGVKINNNRAKITNGNMRANNGVVLSSGSAPFQPLLATVIRGNVGFITLSYTNHGCVLRTQDLRDLNRKLEDFESRKGINVIVLKSSSDRIFCDGCDYKELIHSDLNKRKKFVTRRIICIKNVLNTLAISKKLLIASVNGGKVGGFGLMLLGLFDLVYANDKATFTLQRYFQLKQPPEGISVFNPTQLQSPTMKSFVYMGRVSTASEMHQNGFLVTEIFWDGSKYHEQFASKLQNANSQHHTKSIYKTYSSKNTKQLANDLAHECSILESIWMSESWQKNAVQLVQKDRLNF